MNVVFHPPYLAGSMLVVGMIMEKELVSHSHEPQPSDYNPINIMIMIKWTIIHDDDHHIL